VSLVGIIANPASGKDIRRLVTQALVIGNREKANIVRRILIGLHAAGASDVRIMPDTFGIGSMALAGLGDQAEAGRAVRLLEMPVSGSALDTARAARLLSEAGAGCIITLGGDGTVRMAAQGSGEVPLLPISTGTNNVLPGFIEGTVAGLAAGYLAAQPQAARQEFCRRAKRLEVHLNGELRDSALVDIAALTGSFTGTRAVWQAADLRLIASTRAAPTTIGLSSVAGMLDPVDPTEPEGVLVTLSGSPNGRRVLAPLGPGLVLPLAYSGVTRMQPGQPYPLPPERPLTLALDGEREIVLKQGDQAALILAANGPWIVNVEQVMAHAVRRRAFVI